MKRSEGERIRLEHSTKRMRDALDSIELNIRLGGPASEAASTLVQTAIEVAMQIAKLDAYDIAERDHGVTEGAKKPCMRPPKGWWCSRGEHEDGPCAARADTRHCNRADGSSPIGVCGGNHHTCSCECSACEPSDEG